jgi:hypothetical protein
MTRLFRLCSNLALISLSSTLIGATLPSNEYAALAPNTNVKPATSFDPNFFTGATEVASLTSFFQPDSLPTASQTPDSVGKLITTVFQGVQVAPGGYSGLTFVYELKNVRTEIAWPQLGLIDLVIAEWADIGVAVAFNAPDENLAYVEHGAVFRSGGFNGDDEIKFTYPPVDPDEGPEPPIFSGEFGMKLVLFTNASDFDPTTAIVNAASFNASNGPALDPAPYYEVNTLRGASPTAAVPDSGGTAALVGATGLGLAAFRRRIRGRPLK